MSAIHRFTQAGTEEIQVIGGRTHYWHSKPDYTSTEDLLVVRVRIEPGGGHGFHYHPNKEEVIYYLAGEAEQWIGDEKQVMRPGSSVYIPKDVIHATFNKGDQPLEFIAIITPLSAEGPVGVELPEHRS